MRENKVRSPAPPATPVGADVYSEASNYTDFITTHPLRVTLSVNLGLLLEFLTRPSYACSGIGRGETREIQGPRNEAFGGLLIRFA